MVKVMWIGEWRHTVTWSERWGNESSHICSESRTLEGTQMKPEGLGKSPSHLERSGTWCAEGRAQISNESFGSNGTDWTPTGKWIIRKVKEDKENEKHELASYGCVNPFLVIHEIVGQILKETLIKGTEKNEIKCNTGLPKAVCARLCWHLPLIR